jgi:hypothetical protein
VTRSITEEEDSLKEIEGTRFVTPHYHRESAATAPKAHAGNKVRADHHGKLASRLVLGPGLARGRSKRRRRTEESDQELGHKTCMMIHEGARTHSAARLFDSSLPSQEATLLQQRNYRSAFHAHARHEKIAPSVDR